MIELLRTPDLFKTMPKERNTFQGDQTRIPLLIELLQWNTFRWSDGATRPEELPTAFPHAVFQSKSAYALLRFDLFKLNIGRDDELQRYRLHWAFQHVRSSRQLFEGPSWVCRSRWRPWSRSASHWRSRMARLVDRHSNPMRICWNCVAERKGRVKVGVSEKEKSDHVRFDVFQIYLKIIISIGSRLFVEESDDMHQFMLNRSRTETTTLLQCHRRLLTSEISHLEDQRWCSAPRDLVESTYVSTAAISVLNLEEHLISSLTSSENNTRCAFFGTSDWCCDIEHQSVHRIGDLRSIGRI